MGINKYNFLDFIFVINLNMGSAIIWKLLLKLFLKENVAIPKDRTITKMFQDSHIRNSIINRNLRPMVLNFKSIFLKFIFKGKAQDYQ